MLPYAELTAQGLSAGFTHIAPLRADTLRPQEEVREMCRACKVYGTCWSCPPGCGSLEDCRAKIALYSEGILVQTVGELEDDMDGEGMMETERLHKAHFLTLYEDLRPRYPQLLALGAGRCGQCRVCPCPDAPCRFPDRMVSSMEAYGILVSQTCRDNSLGYYYGPRTIAYTSCFLLQ